MAHGSDPVPAPWLQAASVLGEAALLQRLHRHARSQLRNAALAEDAVSDAVLAALTARRSFAGPEQALAWLHGVLRHKLVDQLRRQHREQPAGDFAAEGPDADPEPLGDPLWPVADAPWHDPEQAGVQRQFIERLADCLQRLPPRQAEAFVLREVWGLEADAICARLDVNPRHLWVLLHRARRRLQALLPGCWPLGAIAPDGVRSPPPAA